MPSYLESLFETSQLARSGPRTWNSLSQPSTGLGPKASFLTLAQCTRPEAEAILSCLCQRAIAAVYPRAVSAGPLECQTQKGKGVTPQSQCQAPTPSLSEGALPCLLYQTFQILCEAIDPFSLGHPSGM